MVTKEDKNKAMKAPLPSELDRYIESHLRQEERPDLTPFLQWFAERFGESLQAVLFYGSCLHPSTQTATSIPDFYVIVDSYRRARLPFSHYLLSPLLPPHLYFLRSGGRFCKYNLLSYADASRIFQGAAHDIYNMGRLSKRFGLLYAAPELRQAIVSGYRRIVERMIGLALPLLPPQTRLEELVKKALALSYLGERRVEADDKIDRLFQAERAFYLTVYASQMAALVAAGAPYTYDPERQAIRFVGDERLHRLAARRSRLFLWQSRLKTYLRWPKYAFTIDGWVDYLLAKVERAKGIRLELSEKERRYPLIYGWKYLRELKRKGHFH